MKETRSNEPMALAAGNLSPLFTQPAASAVGSQNRTKLIVFGTTALRLLDCEICETREATYG